VSLPEPLSSIDTRKEYVVSPADDNGPLIYGGGGGPRTRLLCGGFVLAESLPRHLLALLPGVLGLDAATSGVHHWMAPVFELLSAEGWMRSGRSAARSSPSSPMCS
jgi:hypothetical protein